MLENALALSLKSSVVLCVLYLTYLLVLSKNTRYQFRRLVLVTIALLSVLLPLVRLQVAHSSIPQEPAINQVDQVMTELTYEDHSTEARKTSDQKPGQDLTPSRDKWTLLKLAKSSYLAGLCVAIIILTVHLSRIIFLLRTGEKVDYMGSAVVRHKRVSAPFSFWNWIFLPNQADYDTQSWEVIERHENAHLSQLHSLDLVLASLIKILLWYNPFAYLLHASIKKNHEYLADRHVLKTHGFDQYSRILLSECLQVKNLQIVHSFSLQSNLKKRIQLMKTVKTSRFRSIIQGFSLLTVSLIMAAQVSLYGQTDSLAKLDQRLNSIMTASIGGESFNSLKVLEKTGKNPDAWVSFKEKGVAPLVLLPSQKQILEDFQMSSMTPNGFTTLYRIFLSEDKDPPFPYHKMVKNRGTVELVKQLSTEELISMYQLSEGWADLYIRQVYPDFQLPDEIDFLEKKYLIIESFPNPVNPGKYSVKTIFESREVDQMPEPVGGLERYLKNVTKYAEKNPELNLNDLPDDIAFQFTIDPGGNMVMLSLKSNVEGTDEVQDKVFDLLKQLNDNMLKVSEVYGWEPGKKDGESVATQMRLSIPKELLSQE